MIAEYEADNRPGLFEAPRMYGVSQSHKHLPEMQKICGLSVSPVFCPVVAPYYSGMEVVIPIFRDTVNANATEIKQVYKEYYKSGLIHFVDNPGDFLPACEFSGFDDMEISVCGNDDRILLISRFDNLGKGASGSAIQNLNICLGLDECLGLNQKTGGKG